MKRKFIPSFLNNLDKNWLLNKPGLWASRIHFVVFFSIISIILLVLFGYIFTPPAQQASWLEVVVPFVALISFLGLVFWIIYLLRFNVFKRFAAEKPLEGLRTWALLFAGVFFIVLPTNVLPAVESHLANRAFTSDRIVKDINFLNESLLKLNKRYAPHQWVVDTAIIVKPSDHRAYPGYEYATVAADPVQTLPSDTTATADYVVPRKAPMIVVDTNLIKIAKSQDSVVKVSDTVYAFLNAPNLKIFGSSAAEDHSPLKENSSLDLFKKYFLNNEKYDTAGVQQKVLEVMNNYREDRYRFDVYTKGPESNFNYEGIINDQYKIYDVQRGISNVTQKKYRWDLDNFGTYFRIIFYLSFFISLLIFIFRHSTPKTFFLSLLTAVVLFIFSAIMLVMMRSTEEMTVYFLFLLYWLIALVMSLLILKNKTRMVAQGIALNLLTFFTMLVPLAALAWMDALRRWENRMNLNDYQSFPSHYFLAAEIIGVVAVIILLQPFFKRLYRRWFSLPED